MNAELKRFNTKRSLTSSTYVCGETMFFEQTWVIPRTKEESFGSLRLNISLAVNCLKWDKAKPMFHVAIIKHKNGLKKTRLQSFLFFVCWKINTYFSKKKKKKNVPYVLQTHCLSGTFCHLSSSVAFGHHQWCNRGQRIRWWKREKPFMRMCQSGCYFCSVSVNMLSAHSANRKRKRKCDILWESCANEADVSM